MFAMLFCLLFLSSKIPKMLMICLTEYEIKECSSELLVQWLSLFPVRQAVVPTGPRDPESHVIVWCRGRAEVPLLFLAWALPFASALASQSQSVRI